MADASRPWQSRWWLTAGFVLLATIANADPTFVGGDPFAADGNLLDDWGVDLTTQTGSGEDYGVSTNKAWTTDDLTPWNLQAGKFAHEVKDDDTPANHGGEAFDVETLWFAQDDYFFYFAMLTSVPPDGARDPYYKHQNRTYGGVSQRRRFFPGDIALSIVKPHPSDPTTDLYYEYGIVIAPPDPLRAADFPSKDVGDVWRKEPQLDWFKPDADRSADATTFANFKTSGSNPGAEVYDGAAAGNTTALYHGGTPGIGAGYQFDEIHHQGSYDAMDPIYGSNLPVELYYGPARDPLPAGSFEGPGGGMGSGGAYYPEIWWSSGWKYMWCWSSDSGIPIDTYVFEAKYPKALFLEGFRPEDFEDKYVMHWTMGCANDALAFNITLSFEPLIPIPEPFSAAFMSSVFLGAIAHGVGRRYRRRR